MAKVTLNGTSDALLAILAAVTGRDDIQIADLELTNGGNVPPVRQRGTVETAPAPKPEPERKRNGPPRAAVRYHVTRKGNGNLDKMAIGAKAKQVLTYLRDHGPRGLAELQAELGRGRNPIKPKTVDGSVYQLRQAELIQSRNV